MATEKIRTFENGVLTAERDIVVPDPAPEDYAAAIQSHIDAAAASRGYGSGAMLASYIASSVTAWAAEAAAFVAWRDAVWLAAYGLFAKVQAGETTAPSIPDLIASLPPIRWPGA